MKIAILIILILMFTISCNRRFYTLNEIERNLTYRNVEFDTTKSFSVNVVGKNFSKNNENEINYELKKYKKNELLWIEFSKNRVDFENSGTLIINTRNSQTKEMKDSLLQIIKQRYNEKTKELGMINDTTKYFINRNLNCSDCFLLKFDNIPINTPDIENVLEQLNTDIIDCIIIHPRADTLIWGSRSYNGMVEIYSSKFKN